MQSFLREITESNLDIGTHTPVFKNAPPPHTHIHTLMVMVTLVFNPYKVSGDDDYDDSDHESRRQKLNERLTTVRGRGDYNKYGKREFSTVPGLVIFHTLQAAGEGDRRLDRKPAKPQKAICMSSDVWDRLGKRRVLLN